MATLGFTFVCLKCGHRKTFENESENLSTPEARRTVETMPRMCPKCDGFMVPDTDPRVFP